jgi:deazaflavin-dependent oxidoreductase (nitroreductase family)
MAMSRTSESQGPPRTPPPWLNRLMAGMLRTPGLQRLVGRGTALLTFTGRRSGRAYTTPVSYARSDDRVVLLSHPSRTWWRNLPDRPRVELRLAGRDHVGTASVLTGDDPAALALVRDYLDQQRMAARAAKVRRDRSGAFRTSDLRRLLDESVVVAVRLDGP